MMSVEEHEVWRQEQIAEREARTNEWERWESWKVENACSKRLEDVRTRDGAALVAFLNETLRFLEVFRKPFDSAIMVLYRSVPQSTMKLDLSVLQKFFAGEKGVSLVAGITEDQVQKLVVRLHSLEGWV
ncbi:hypothetical protein HY493_04905 [Candidatus Woesearchaeota archaeon]|nr:hypothetical protein [Candidatus Woesearchaeota archaeon]